MGQLILTFLKSAFLSDKTKPVTLIFFIIFFHNTFTIYFVKNEYNIISRTEQNVWS